MGGIHPVNTIRDSSAHSNSEFSLFLYKMSFLCHYVNIRIREENEKKKIEMEKEKNGKRQLLFCNEVNLYS